MQKIDKFLDYLQEELKKVSPEEKAQVILYFLSTPEMAIEDYISGYTLEWIEEMLQNWFSQDFLDTGGFWKIRDKLIERL